MFKSLLLKSHKEFIRPAQQDANEFIHWLLDEIQQKEHVNHVDPTSVFRFQLEDRLQCSQCHHVKYTSVPASEVSLPIPLPAPLAEPTDAQAAPTAGRKTIKRYPPVAFSACWEEWAHPVDVDEWNCAVCKRATKASKCAKPGTRQ